MTAPGFLESVQRQGERLAAGLAALALRHGLGQGASAVSGRGLLGALALPAGLSSTTLADAARQGQPGDGLLVNPAQPQRLRLMPALNISASEVDQALRLLDAALARTWDISPT